jgi:FMN phosphatase YigB (HAD superfamily)
MASGKSSFFNQFLTYFNEVFVLTYETFLAYTQKQFIITKGVMGEMGTVFAEVSRVNINTAVSGDSTLIKGTAVHAAEYPSEPRTEVPSLKLLRGIKGIIFDSDGTLFDNPHIALNLVAAYPPDLFRIGNERRTRWRFFGCDYSSPEAYHQAYFTVFGKLCSRSPEHMRNWYFNRYMPRMVRVLKKHYQLRPGVAELFRRFESPYALRVAVYSDYHFLTERLEVLGQYSSPRIPLYGPESFGAQKPAAGPLIRIAANLGIAPEETLVVGDREDTDGLGAFRAGMRFFCLETGHKRYYRLDPARQRVKQALQGPSLVMYAGTWDNLVKALLSN